MANINTHTPSIKDDVAAYRKGKRDFSVDRLHEIKVYLLKLKDVISDCVVYKGRVKSTEFVGCIQEEFHSDLIDYIFKIYNPQVAFVVSPSRGIVIFKKDKNSTFNLCEFVKVICNSVCINEELATGTLTENFLKFTQTLTQC